MSEHSERTAGIGGIEGERGVPVQQGGPRERGEAERGAMGTSERLADSPIPHMNKETPLLVQIAILVLLAGGLFLMIRFAPPAPLAPDMATSTQVSATAVSMPVASTTAPKVAPSATTTIATTTVKKVVPTPVAQPSVAAPSNPNQVHRIEHPYTTSPLSFEVINEMTRLAVVNIFCSSRSGLLRPISGSGIMIDPRGVILTNAHVAQYVLLAESGRVNLQCAIRTGSPAVAKWAPHVLYIPPVWIEEHAADLTKERPFGTGKHDFALLYVGTPLDGTARPTSFSSLSFDTREAIGFIDDSVLAASYPAEFLGSITANINLYHVTSLTTIDELYTLGSKTVDVLSIGSVIGAQSGSSGGAIVNAWGRLIGVITTTSAGATTGERKLRGITLSYIDRDLLAQTGLPLSAYISGDLRLMTTRFSTESAPALVEKLMSQLK
ncbi:MAG: S1 family peptidase [Minisyncoccota bacterium]